MRRQTGNELDWQKIASSVSQLSGTLQGADKYKDYKKEVADRETKVAAQDTALGMRREGFSPEETRTALQGRSMAQPGLDEKFNTSGVAMNWQQQDKDPTITATQAEAGMQGALDLEIASAEKKNKAKVAEFSKIYAQWPEEKRNSFDPRTQGEDAKAWQDTRDSFYEKQASSSANKAQIDKARKDALEGKWKDFQSSIYVANNFLKDGDRERAGQLMEKATNQDNNTAYRAEYDPTLFGGRGGMTPYIMEDGEEVRSDKSFPLEEYDGELKNIGKSTFSKAFYDDAKMSVAINKEPAKWYTNDDGDILQVKAYRDPWSADHQYHITNLSGGNHETQDLQELRKKGFYQYTPKTQKAGAKTADPTNKNIASNMKVLDKASELILQSGRYTKDPDTGAITETATGNPAGEQFVMEAIQLMPRLGKALSEGEIQQLLASIGTPQTDSVYDELGVVDQPAGAIRGQQRVTPLTNPELRESPFQQ